MISDISPGDHSASGGTAAAEQLLSIWEGAGEDDPSLDMLQHQRRIAIIASGEGSGSKVTDLTSSAA